MKTTNRNKKIIIRRAHKAVWRECALIFCGTLLMAMAIRWIFDPAGMVTGGFTGISILVKELTKRIWGWGMPLGITNLFLNVPLFLAALKIKGHRYLGKTVSATVLLSVWLTIIPEWNMVGKDIFLTSVFGGILFGSGLGVVLRSDATTGGTDLTADLISTHYRQFSLTQIMQILDALIVLAGALVFGLTMALYAVAAIYLIARISDSILEGAHFAKGIYVITDYPEKIADDIMKQIGRGVTGISAMGMYTGKNRKMLFCVVSRKEIVRLKELIRERDTNAFVIISDVREVLGEGFISESA